MLSGLWRLVCQRIDRPVGHGAPWPLPCHIRTKHATLDGIERGHVYDERDAKPKGFMGPVRPSVMGPVRPGAWHGSCQCRCHRGPAPQAPRATKQRGRATAMQWH
eukprot:364818-Chlamydomonas_euryale.AAC.25